MPPGRSAAPYRPAECLQKMCQERQEAPKAGLPDQNTRSYLRRSRLSISLAGLAWKSGLVQYCVTPACENGHACTLRCDQPFTRQQLASQKKVQHMQGNSCGKGSVLLVVACSPPPTGTLPGSRTPPVGRTRCSKTPDMFSKQQLTSERCRTARLDTLDNCRWCPEQVDSSCNSPHL